MRFVSNSRIDGHPFFTITEEEREHMYHLSLESLENSQNDSNCFDIGITNLFKLHKNDPIVKLNMLIPIDDLLSRIDEFEVIKDYKLDLISLNSLCDFCGKEFNESKIRELGFDIY